MSHYVVAATQGEYGIDHIEADTRDEAVHEYVASQHDLDIDSDDLASLEIGVVLESDVRYFSIEPTFKVVRAFSPPTS